MLKYRKPRRRKALYTHKGRYCDFHICTWDETKHYCTLTKKEVKCNKVDKDCPIIEYPTDFIRSIVQDLERLSDKVHELSQAYMSDELYDVHADMAECIEGIKIVFGKEASE